MPGFRFHSHPAVYDVYKWPYTVGAVFACLHLWHPIIIIMQSCLKTLNIICLLHILQNVFKIMYFLSAVSYANYKAVFSVGPFNLLWLYKSGSLSFHHHKIRSIIDKLLFDLSREELVCAVYFIMLSTLEAAQDFDNHFAHDCTWVS